MAEKYTVEAKKLESGEVFPVTIAEFYSENGDITLSAVLEGREYTGADYRYFEAFKKLKDKLLEAGFGLNCRGARVNALQSEIASASDKIYLVKPGERAGGYVSFYSYSQNTLYPTGEEQENCRQEWFNSLK